MKETRRNGPLDVALMVILAVDVLMIGLWMLACAGVSAVPGSPIPGQLMALLLVLITSTAALLTHRRGQ